MIFIGGVQPKTVTVDDTPQRCPSCGLVRAHTRRIDHYLSLFFIPLFRVKTGEPFLYCDRCEAPVFEEESSTPPWQQPVNTRCHHCGGTIRPDFKFCPHCGHPAGENHG